MTVSEPPDSNSPPGLRACFFGPEGLRAGWRLMIYAALLVTLLAGKNFVVRKTMQDAGEVARYFVGHQLFRFLLCAGTAFIMSRLEHRKLGDYGLPRPGLLRREFWLGLVIGFGALTTVLVAMRACGVFSFGAVELHGPELVRMGLLYGGGFLFVALSEEFHFFGYTRFTLATGIGFWPTAVCMSAFFVSRHAGNSGENILGLVNVAAFGLLMCLIVRQTGNLWLAIGLHTAWDWGQTFFYGVPNSGRVYPAHFMQSHTSGPGWLSGGAAGPEGSLLCTGVFLVLAAAIRNQSIRSKFVVEKATQ